MQKFVLLMFSIGAFVLFDFGGSAAIDPAVEEYAVTVQSIMSSYGSVIEEIQSLIWEAGENSALLQSSQWQEEVSTALIALHSTGDQVRALDSPPGFEAHRDALMDAARHAETAAGSFAKAIDAADADLMLAGENELHAATNDAGRANDLFRQASW